MEKKYFSDLDMSSIESIDRVKQAVVDAIRLDRPHQITGKAIISRNV